ncbi:MAG: PIN domain-containing protein [Candidatus Jordarchaeum sp.]|uniref:PIN domain-containing protein n=1 Tax=Candidatus Jordarchaeum sp. TaxID=2823881 RepID=UPI004049DBC3
MQRSYALVTSFLIYLYYLEKNDNIWKIVENGFCNLVTLSEMYHVTYRKEGHVGSVKFIEKLIKISKIVPSEELALIVGQFKCKYPISLADCWVLATGKKGLFPHCF